MGNGEVGSGGGGEVVWCADGGGGGGGGGGGADGGGDGVDGFRVFVYEGVKEHVKYGSPEQLSPSTLGAYDIVLTTFESLQVT